MLVTQVLFAASLTLGQVLLAEQRYFWYAVAPLLYNAGIIVGDGRAERLELGIFGPAIGAVIGAGIHLGSRFIGLRGSAFRGSASNGGLRTPAVREFVRLMLPRMVSQPVEPITFVFFTSIASRTRPQEASRSFNYARNFQSAPVTLVGVAFAVAAFPALSAALRRWRPARRSCDGSARTAISITVLTVACRPRPWSCWASSASASCSVGERSAPMTWR